MFAVEKSFKSLVVIAVAFLLQACSSSVSDTRTHVRYKATQHHSRHALVSYSAAPVKSSSIKVSALPVLRNDVGVQAVSGSVKVQPVEPVAIFKTDSVKAAHRAEPTISITAAEEASEDETSGEAFEVAFSDTVSDGELDQTRGGAFGPDVFNVSDLNANLTKNTVIGAVTGTNQINSDAFSNSAGLISLIQNSGNGVIIQSSTSVTLNIFQ